MDSAVYLSSDRKVEVIAPLIDDTKTTILKKGMRCSPPVPYTLTRTCYKDQAVSCGRCGSCRERREAFDNIGMVDPVPYATDKEV